MEKNRHTEEPFHLGKMIKEELDRQGRSITWLAKQIDCTRSNLYKLFRNPWINTQILFKICRALNRDFFKECSDWHNRHSSVEGK